MADKKKTGFAAGFKKILPYLLAFCLPALLLYIAYAAFGIWPWGEKSVLVLDLNGQYVYYYEGLKNALFGSGSIFYSWSRNLSGEFFGIIGYYLASPFSIIPVLLPRTVITEGILIMQLAKTGACGVTFSYYLNKTKRANSFSGVMFGALYALIGYNVVQLMNPMWIDGVIYLPLIILGIEQLVRKKRILPFAIPLGLMFMANFYIGYMVGIFSALYFLVFLASEKNSDGWKKPVDRILRAGGGALIALMIGAITIIPIYKSLFLGKMSFSTPPTYSAYEKFTVVSVLGKLLPFSYDSVNVDGLPFVYCGVITLLLAPLYFASKKISLKKKIYSMGLLVGTFALMYVSTFDLLMHGGQWPNWLNYRYSFVFSFLLLTLAAQAFSDLDSIERNSVFKVYGVIAAVIVFFNSNWVDYIKEEQSYWYVLIALSFYLACVLIIKYKPAAMKICVVCLTLFISVELVFNAIDSFNKIDDEVAYSTRDSYTEWYDEFSPVVEHVKSTDDSVFRMDTTYHRTVNDPMALDIYGVSHSSSMMNSSALDFLSAMGYTSRGFESKYFGGTIVGDSLIGLKYAIVEWEDKGTAVIPKTRLGVYDDLYDDVYSNGYVLHVYENPYALPLAFYASQLVITTKFETLNENNVFENQNLLLNNILGTQDVEYFKQVEITNRTLTNVAEYDAVDQMRYVPAEAALSASVDYSLSSDLSGELYMFIPTKYHRRASINFDGKNISDYFADDYHTALGLGKIDAGETDFVSVILAEDDLYMQSPLFYVLDEKLFAEAVEKIRANPSEVTMKNASHLSVNATAPDNGYLYTSIPYERGWKAKVDGKKITTVCVADSLLAVPLAAGEHKVELSFVPSGFVAGVVINLLGVAVVVLMIVDSKKHIFKKLKKIAVR